MFGRFRIFQPRKYTIKSILSGRVFQSRIAPEFFLPGELLFRSEIEWLEYAILTNLVKAEAMGIDTACCAVLAGSFDFLHIMSESDGSAYANINFIDPVFVAGP